MTARGFPAFAPGPARRPRSRWGVGWADALTRSALDLRPLRRGRRYAARGHVGPITVSAGRVAAAVHDGDPELAHRTVVRVDPLRDGDWERLTAELADRSGWRAALLAGELPADLGAAAGVALLPEPAELLPECDCPDWEHPCAHAAALCHQVSWLLDAEPLLLLLIRGRDPGELTGAAGRHATAGALARRDGAAAPVGGDRDGAAAPADGEPAGEAYARVVPPLPAPLGEPPAPQAPAPLPAGPGVDPDALRALVAAAAARAAQLLSVSAAPHGPGTPGAPG
ncbi:SWIM zinc finger family protein [Micromonospora psammae]|uniref:SWIM zinc finger family protein n=1 Tax=Micromonospora sp. CPCC 205556 TaxID=3122398 RepID=UPI002FEE819D